jgi:hypothetical protein
LGFIGGFELGMAESCRAVNPHLLLVRAAKVQGRGKFSQYFVINRRIVSIDYGYETAH